MENNVVRFLTLLCCFALLSCKRQTNAPTAPISVDAAKEKIGIKLTGSPRFHLDDTAAIEDASDAEQSLYQAQVYGTFGVQITGLAPAKYRVVIGNAELSPAKTGYRIFSISANDRVMVKDLDLFTQFGAAKKGDVTFEAEAENGVLDIQFTENSGHNFPRMSFVRVFDSSSNALITEKNALSLKPPGWNHLQHLGLDPAVLNMQRTAPPWAGTYKIRPEEKEKLTAADVPGPDGIVYPNWRHAGIAGGIPEVPVKATAEEFGAIVNDNLDDTDAFERGLAAVSQKSGGALLLAAGTYQLNRPLVISQDGVVLRGAGADKTKIVFSYDALVDGVFFVSPRPGEIVTENTWIEAATIPKDLKNLRFEINGKIVQSWRSPSEGPEYSVGVRAKKIVDQAGAGEHQVSAIAEYKDGSRREQTIRVTVHSAATDEPKPAPSYHGYGAISFFGGGSFGPKIKLAKDGKRGDVQLTLAPNHKLMPGERVVLHAPATKRWNALVENAAKWGAYRENQYPVTAVEGDVITIAQPLRIDFPVQDESYVRRIKPLTRSGAENFTLEQTRDVWTNGVFFVNTWECWARGVTVKKAGRQPIYFVGAKHGEVRDCVADDAWFKGGGGTAYVGWENAFDCLMENVTTYKLRHAPCLNWAASGTVFRNSTFYDSDGQWHSGWCNENLFENLVIHSAIGDGSYGFGLWASPPEDKNHGPNGPRNVVYNCDITSQKAGLWMGGMNENWLILHNRFVVERGPGIVMRTASFDHIIKDNVFCLKKPLTAGIYLATPDCIGVEIIGNTFHGAKEIAEGPAKPVVLRDNQLSPFAVAPRPQPAVSSIFEWQRKK